ncbi:MAG: hypothetical protein AAGD96_00265, partial [Chloroflexota bacterium]
PRLVFRLQGTLEDKISAEETAMETAFLKLKGAKETLEVLKSESKAVERELFSYSNIDSTIEELALGITGSSTDKRLGLAIKTAQTHLHFMTLEKTIVFGEQAEAKLKLAQRELQQIREWISNSNILATPPQIPSVEECLSQLQNAGNSIELSIKDLKTFSRTLEAQAHGILYGLAPIQSKKTIIHSPDFITRRINESIEEIENLRISIQRSIKVINQQKQGLIKNFSMFEQKWDVQGNY